MQNVNYKLVRKTTSSLLAAVTASMLLAGCSGGGSTAGQSSLPTSPRAESTVSGSAIKGVIRNGLVSAYRVENVSGVLERSSTALTSAVRTSESGAYSLTVQNELNDQTLIIEVTADAQTQMMCDATDGCGEDADNNPISFGQWFDLSEDFVLSGLVTGVDSGESVNAHLSPLTHMVVARAEAALEGLSVDSINAAIQYIEAQFDLDTGAINLAPADITALDSIAGLTKSQLESGIVSAAILSLVNTADWDSIDEVLNHLSEKLAAGGEIASVNLGSLRDVALDDVFYNANEIAQDIIVLDPESGYASSLSSVVDETQSSYDEVAQAPEEVAPVEIISQPSAIEVDEGGEAQLTVVAQGGGSLSFQWRKDEVNISGANSATYTIGSAELGHAGVYDVVVSNSVGSDVSLDALLQVNELVVVPDPEPVVATIALTWDTPTEREDGSALELYEIDGYVIAYGTDTNNLSESVTVTGGGQLNATIEDLSTGTYYFAIATVDSDGLRGEFSELITQTVL